MSTVTTQLQTTLPRPQAAKKPTAAGIIRRHIHTTFDYGVMTLCFIAEIYGFKMTDRVVALLYRLNQRKGLTAQYYPTYTKWVSQ